MFENKRTLIVVYKDEMLINQLRKLVETKDDTDGRIVGTKDNSINIVSWTEKVWLDQKKAGNIQGKILFLGDIKGTDKLIPVLDNKFDECGVKYGWAGNQAVLYVDPKCLSDRNNYDEFLAKLSDLPIPEFLKEEKESVVNPSENKTDDSDKASEDENKNKHKNIFRKIGDRVAVRTEEIFRDKSLMKRQMMFYGLANLYQKDLDSFLNT